MTCPFDMSRTRQRPGARSLRPAEWFLAACGIKEPTIAECFGLQEQGPGK